MSLPIKPRVKRLFADIETSPNIGFFWRSGYELNIGPENIIHERKIICVCWKWEEEPDVHYVTWDNNQNDKSGLKEFILAANEADEIIGHKGDSFDWPWVRTRALIHGLTPIPSWKTIDTLQWARKYFYFNSNKLDYLGKILGHGQKLHTDFDLWKSIVLHRCPIALAKMVRYCQQDVRLLEKVWTSMRFCVQPKTHSGVFAGLDKWTCPHCASTKVEKSKTRITASGNKQHQMRCLNERCNSYYSISQTSFEDYQKAKAKALARVSRLQGAGAHQSAACLAKAKK